MTADRAYRRFKLATRAARLDNADRLRFHDLRHSTVSGLVQRGFSLQMIWSYMGHSTPFMTQRYSHIADKHLEEVADGLTGTISAQIDSAEETARSS